MDILSHTLSGLAIGTVIASFCQIEDSKIKVIIFGGLGGALPDIDAISLWSQFDQTFGKWFQLANTGEDIYTGKLWYSHHAFMHSLLCAVILSGLIMVIFCPGEKANTKMNYLLSVSFFLGFNIHLAEDMPTPVGAWGGVNYFFPAHDYIGGYGNIWWWNNYDLFLIVMLVFIINSLLLFSKKCKKVAIPVFIIGVIIFLSQIQKRELDYTLNSKNYGYVDSETKSKEFQKKVLGNHIFTLMEKFDSFVKINF